MRPWPGTWSARLSSRGGVVLVSSRNRNASLVEGEVATDDGETRPSGQAQDAAGQSQGNVSDPEPPDVPKKSGCLVKYLWALMIGGAVGFVGLAAVVGWELELFAGGSEASNDSATESTVADQGAASAGSASDTDGSASDTEGSISGTWAMYWHGSDNLAFEITFIGSDTGTLEILNDATETDTAFEVDGDQVWFKFTRTFEVAIGKWPEKSTFEGTLTGLHEMTGKWNRQDWECSPDGGCKYTGKWSPYDARLIRISE